MGDLYKCKKCGQLCYGASVSEVDGTAAAEILSTIEQNGFIEAPDSIPFLDSDFSQFLQKREGVAAVRYEANPTFPYVLRNMRADKVVIGTKTVQDGYVFLSCPVCESQEFFSRIGSLPTTFTDGKWENYQDSDHAWYLLSDGNRGNGSFTGLELRELTSYINKEDRLDAQQLYDEILQEGYNSVEKKNTGFTQTKNVDLTQYFRTLMSVKTDIQIMETRLFDLLISHLPAEREFINSMCRSEETIVSEINKEKHENVAELERLTKELEFHLREDWREAHGITIPQEPVKPVISAPAEPEYRQAGLFNRKEVMDENNLLRADYSAKVQEYNTRLRDYATAMELYKKAKEEYIRLQKETYEKELNAWETDPDNVAKKQRVADLTARDAELDEMLQNPMERAQKMLENSGPAKIRNLYESELKRNVEMLKKAYQTETDLQSVLFVFPKYLDIVAVSKIYEYLVTGRVTSLTGANGAYTLYESEMRSTRTPTLPGVSRKTENIAAREFTIYNALSAVSKIMSEIGEKTEAAIKEMRTSNSTEASEEYNHSADAFYSLIEEDLKICREYSDRYNPNKAAEEPAAAEPETSAEKPEAEPESNEESAPETPQPEAASPETNEPETKEPETEETETEKPETSKPEPAPAQAEPETPAEVTPEPAEEPAAPAAAEAEAVSEGDVPAENEPAAEEPAAAPEITEEPEPEADEEMPEILVPELTEDLILDAVFPKETGADTPDPTENA